MAAVHLLKWLLPMTMLTVQTEGFNYRHLVKQLDPQKCTFKQYAAILVGGNTPEETDCGTEVATSPMAFMEGTNKYYPPGLAVLSENCLVVCTPYAHKSFHSEAGVIANHRLIRGLKEQAFTKVWLLTFLEPCDEAFRRNTVKVGSCTDKIVKFCQKFNGRVRVLYNENYKTKSRRTGTNQMANTMKVCADYRKTLLASRIIAAPSTQPAFACGISGGIRRKRSSDPPACQRLPSNMTANFTKKKKTLERLSSFLETNRATFGMQSKEGIRK